MKRFCILKLPISYCVSLIMVTITRHIFINFFQTEHLLEVKFAMGYEKNMRFLVIQKSLKMLKNWTGVFNTKTLITQSVLMSLCIDFVCT